MVLYKEIAALYYKLQKAIKERVLFTYYLKMIVGLKIVLFFTRNVLPRTKKEGTYCFARFFPKLF